MHRNSFILSITLLLLLPLLILSNFLTRPTPPSPTCHSRNYLIGTSATPKSLAQFLHQFPASTPPQDLCLLFLTSPHHNYTLFNLPNLQLLPDTHGIYTAYQIALQHATTILLADDHTFFDTTRYGTGKSDVNTTIHVFHDLLPRPETTRKARGGVINSAAVLSGRPVLERTMPESYLRNSGGAELSYDTLDDITAFYPEPLVTTFLPLTPDTRPAHARFQQRFPLDMVLEANDTGGARKSLYHSPGSLGRVAKPVLFERLAAWVLPWDDVIAGYVVQRALWEAGRGVLIIPGMDLWRAGGGGEENGGGDRLDEVVEFLENVEIPGSLRFVDEVFVFLLNALWKHGWVEKDVVARVRQFHSALRRRGVARLLRRPYIIGERDDVETAVCVTGQMRSAAFTARNLMESLKQGIIGGFDVFVVTERDDRSAAARLFNAKSVWYSTEPKIHGEWIQQVRKSPIVHETMSSERELRNYLKQLWDMRECERSVREYEQIRGRKYRWMVRTRPDTVFTKRVNSRIWTGRLSDGRHGLRHVVYGRRHSYYAMNDRFFAGDRALMGRIMSCHDLFGFLMKTGKVYGRKADTHMMFKKSVNSERFLGRCAVWKRVALKGSWDVEVMRVALSEGVAKWREF